MKKIFFITIFIASILIPSHRGVCSKPYLKSCKEKKNTTQLEQGKGFKIYQFLVAGFLAIFICGVLPLYVIIKEKKKRKKLSIKDKV